MYLFASLLVCCCAPACPSAMPADSVQREMHEVEVKAARQSGVSENPQGRIYWDMAALENMPHVLGTADPLRSLQLLPGIATNNDYSSGIHVQGSSSAHTLPEIDGAPVFNASHFLGLFSVFTASHFRGMSLTKSRHDASFGNYLGGQLEFHPLDSIAQNVHLNATVSFMESEGTLTLPAGRKGTLYVSGRGSYLDLIYGNLMDIDEMKMKYGLQDWNLTYILRPDQNNKLQINFYHGRDRADLLQKYIQSNCRLNWHNTLASLNWLHGGARCIVRQTAFFSRYDNRLGLNLGSILFNQNSELFQTGYKGTVQRTAGRTEWNAGAEYKYTALRPMQFSAEGSFLLNTHPAVREQAHEASAWADIRFSASARWTFSGGLRLSAYCRGTQLRVHPQPRVTAGWQPADGHSLTLHYGMYRQYLHQVTLSNGGLPVDFWTSASADVLPELAHSVTLGYRFESPERTYEASAEVYYKRLTGQYEYHGSILDILTKSYDMAGSLLGGDGENYGLDLMLKRNRGRLTGWIGYSLSRCRRHFPALGSDQWFNAAFERRHDLSVVAEYRITPQWSLGGDFVFASGTPYTAVRSLYMLNMNIINEYGRHNGSYLPATHRMDLSLTYRFARRRRTEQSMNLSVFNVYAHRNVLFRYMNFKEEHYGYRSVHSLCRMLPSVGYTLKF